MEMAAPQIAQMRKITHAYHPIDLVVEIFVMKIVEMDRDKMSIILLLCPKICHVTMEMYLGMMDVVLFVKLKKDGIAFITILYKLISVLKYVEMG